MPKNLPFKICLVCGLPFNWRKKWAKEWENVKYCSQRCKKIKINENCKPDISQPTL